MTERYRAVHFAGASAFAAALLTACSGSSTPALPRFSAPTTIGRSQSDSQDEHSNRKYETITVDLNRKGGTFSMKPYDGFTLSGDYSANNAAHGTALSITNSGTSNPHGAPAPSYGTPVLYIEASVKPRSVAFQVGSGTLKIQSNALQYDAYYDIVIYSGKREVTSYGSAFPTSAGELNVRTPFSGLTIADRKPIIIELVEPSPESLLVPCASSACNYGQVNYYNAIDPVYSHSSVAVSYADSVAVDDSENAYVGANSYKPCQSFVAELYALGGEFSYNDNLDGCAEAPYSIIAAGGSSPAFGVLGLGNTGLYTYLVFSEQGVNTSGTYNDPNLVQADAIALDGAGDVYFAGTNGDNAPEVDILSPSQGLSNLGLQLSGSLRALAIDAQGNLLVSECGGNRNNGVFVFAPGNTSPIAVYDLYDCPTSMVLGNGGNWLYLYHEGSANSYPFVYVYPYPGPGNQTVWSEQMPWQDYASQIAIEPRVPLFNPDNYRKEHPYWKYWGDLKKGHR